MKTEIIGWVTSTLLLGLMVYSNMEGVDWLFATTQVVYWAMYIIAILAATLCFYLVLTTDIDDKPKDAFKQPALSQSLRVIATIGVFIYVGLVALPVVAIIFAAAYLFLRKIVLEEDK